MGFDLLEYVKKSNYENTALIEPAGYGKTQFLLKCFEALKNENGVVPCYIDAAALNTKDLYTELQKYFFKDEKSYLGSIEFFKRFYIWFQLNLKLSIRVFKRQYWVSWIQVWYALHISRCG